MDLLSALGHYLNTVGIPCEEGVDLFLDFTPADPNNVLIFNEYGGAPSQIKSPTMTRSVQICVRDLDPILAKQRCWEIYNSFTTSEDGYYPLTEDRWAVIAPSQPPFKLKEDSQGRTIFVFNVTITTLGD